MRWDMNEVIIETGRSGGGYSKGELKLYQHHSRNEFENSPFHLSMKGRHRGWAQKSQGDRLEPLRRFLHSRVGPNWDEVYSEICEVNDRRSLVGFHLLTHLAQEVEAPGIKNLSYYHPDFYSDESGILRYAPWKWPKAPREPRKIEVIPLEDGWQFSWIKGLWYRTKTEETKRHVSEIKDPVTGWIVRKEGFVTDTKYYKFKCNKKEMKQIRERLRRPKG